MKIRPFFIPFQGCNNQCVYCNQNAITKHKDVNWHELKNQIKQLSTGRNIDEIAFYGGTFSNLPQKRQEELLTPPQSGATFRFSTRPDCLSDSALHFYKNHNVGTIELGVQSFSDKVLCESKRNYTAQTAIKTAKKIQKQNLNLGIQLMPGLPGFCEESLDETIEKTIMLQPDFVRIYPTIVLRNTDLEKKYRRHEFTPLSLDQAIDICGYMKSRFQQKQITIAKIGLHSDISPSDIIAGPYHPSFGELVKANEMVKMIAKQYSKDSVLVLSKRDVSLFKGFRGFFLKRIKAMLSISKLPVYINENELSQVFSFVSKESVAKVVLW